MNLVNYLVFSRYILFSICMLPSGKQVLCVTIFILRMFFKSNPNCCAFRFLIIFYARRSLSENITAMHLGFSNFMHGNLSENPTAVHLGLSNFMQGWHACRHNGFFSKISKTQPSSSPLKGAGGGGGGVQLGFSFFKLRK